MAKRINIILPDEAVRVMDRVTQPGQRSRFISEAIQHYVTATGRARLREQLKQGAVKRAERDLELASEWFSLEQEAWPKDRARSRRK
jgi:CopG family transcriptional regulator / antitoxin EndoAI